MSSVGAPSEAIGNTGVPLVATPNIGDITDCPGFPLVGHVIHTQCCKWDSGKGEAVSAWIFHCVLVSYIKQLDYELARDFFRIYHFHAQVP